MRKNRLQRKKQKSSLKIILFGGLFFCLLGGLAYFLIWHPFLWVKNIEVKSDKEPKYYLPEQIEEIVQGELEKKLFQFVPRKSIVLVSVSVIRENILGRFSEIKSVEIDKKIPDSLKVEITERESIGIWCQIEYFGEKTPKNSDTESEYTGQAATSSEDTRERKIKGCFNIDQEGVVFKESPLIHGNFVLNIYQSKGGKIELREEVTIPQVVEFISITEKELPEIKTTGGLSLSPVDFEIVSEEDLRIKTELGFEIYFNPSYSVDSQLKMLEVVLNEQIKEELTSLAYIDLRIQGRAYYK